MSLSSTSLVGGEIPPPSRGFLLSLTLLPEGALTLNPE